MTDEQLLGRIVIDPKVMVGKPVIKGTRLTVVHILNLLGHGASVDEIRSEHRGLVEEDVRACMLFAANSLADVTFMPLGAEST